MAGCSLTEAFPDVTDKSGKIARKEERKKAAKCGGPALSFLKAEDPDRMAERPDDSPPAMKRKEGFNASDLNLQTADSVSLIGAQVNDVIGEKAKKSLPRACTPGGATEGAADSSRGSEKVPSYFGKSDDSFADFNPLLTDNPGYQIQGAGFGSFDKKGLEKASGQLLPTPVLNNVWKPLTPSGAETSFFKAQYGNKESKDDSFSKDEKQAFLRKLDVLFARLDDLENKKNDYAHTEVSLFILCGLFLLFGLESVRKLK